jgi:hypothetical protein
VAWMGPYGDPSRMVPMAAIFLCIPFYFASVWIEYLVARLMVANTRRQVLRFSWWANFWSYIAIILFWSGCLLTAEPMSLSIPRTTSEEAKAIASIENLGGRVDAYEESQDRSGIRVNLFSGQVTDADLEHLQPLSHRLQSLYLNSNITDAGMKHVKGLTQLQQLSLSETKVTDAGMANLAGLAKLRELSLHKTQVTDAGLEYIRGLTQLQFLYLEDSKITCAGLRHLRD